MKIALKCLSAHLVHFIAHSYSSIPVQPPAVGLIIKDPDSTDGSLGNVSGTRLLLGSLRQAVMWKQ